MVRVMWVWNYCITEGGSGIGCTWSLPEMYSGCGPSEIQKRVTICERDSNEGLKGKKSVSPPLGQSYKPPFGNFTAPPRGRDCGHSQGGGTGRAGLTQPPYHSRTSTVLSPAVGEECSCLRSLCRKNPGITQHHAAGKRQLWICETTHFLASAADPIVGSARSWNIVAKIRSGLVKAFVGVDKTCVWTNASTPHGSSPIIFPGLSGKGRVQGASESLLGASAACPTCSGTSGVSGPIMTRLASRSGRRPKRRLASAGGSTSQMSSAIQKMAVSATVKRETRLSTVSLAGVSGGLSLAKCWIG